MRLPAMLIAPLLGLALAGQADETLRSADTRAQPAATGRSPHCPAALEYYLPGEYYFCVGGKNQLDNRPRIALDYFERAARWGCKNAQYLLGLMHYQGDGTPVDRAAGIAWLTLAAERNDQDMKAALAFARKHATHLERASTEQMLARMRPVYADAVAVERAAKHYERETRDIRRSALYDPFSAYHIAGFASGRASTVLRAMDVRADAYFDRAQGKVTVQTLEVIRSSATLPQTGSEREDPTSSEDE